MYYVNYNSVNIACFRYLKNALKYIKRRGLKENDNNMLLIMDYKGNLYEPVNGCEICAH